MKDPIKYNHAGFWVRLIASLLLNLTNTNPKQSLAIEIFFNRN